MITNTHEYFEELEIEHDFRTYYANGYVEYRTREIEERTEEVIRYKFE